MITISLLPCYVMEKDGRLSRLRSRPTCSSVVVGNIKAVSSTIGSEISFFCTVWFMYSMFACAERSAVSDELLFDKLVEF